MEKFVRNESLKDIFMRAAGRARGLALTNCVSRVVFPRAGMISFAGYAGGNLWLSVKNGLHLFDSAGQVNLDGAAGACLLLSTLAIPFVDHPKYKDIAFRANGATALVGIGLLAASGYYNDGLTAPDWWKTVFPLAGWGATALLTLGQNEIAMLAEKAKASSSSLLKNFGRVAAYPVVYGGLLDGAGIIGMAKSAFNHQDWQLKLICLIWAAGVGGFMASDPRLQNLYKKENHVPLAPGMPSR